jgi:hypothetical protein
VLCGALLVCATGIEASEVDLRLYVTWGGGARRSWQGWIGVTSGTCRRTRSLGIESDAPTWVDADERGIRFRAHSQVGFDGFELQVNAPRDASLVIELAPSEARDGARRHEIPLSPFVLERGSTQKVELDDQDNWLFVRRAPGDYLRVEFERDHLVFSPGDTLTFRLRPYAVGVEAETSLRAAIQLQEAGTERELWREQHDLHADEYGHTDLVGPVTIELPAEEGVYDLVIALSQRRYPEAIGAIMRSKQLMQRKVQLVVIDPRPPVDAAAAWTEVDVMDLTSREWWERWTLLPHLKKLPGVSRTSWGADKGPLGSHPLAQRQHLGETLTEMAEGAWYAAPIPIDRIGEPHLVELWFPNDVRQTLGISIMQPNAAGAVVPFGLDSGIDVPEHPRPAKPRMERHRLLFWPRTKTPWLLLTNRRSDVPAMFGQIRVLAGPTNLPAAPVPQARTEERLLAVYYDKPLFPENFSAPEALDETANRSLKDWTTFHQGGRRLVEYLKYVGYNTAILSVLRDGGALYPSELVDATPRYDTGTFFASGQDPVQKDVLEMLFRLFDREGLRLMPAVHLTCPLPELERLIRAGGPQAQGIELVGVAPDPPRLMSGRELARRGAAPRYNPLDDRVQRAVANLVEELADRYAHHPSFAGVCMQLGPEVCLLFPDEGWPCDDRTFARFESDAKVRVPAEGADRFRKRGEYVRGPGRPTWRTWRARELARFHAELQRKMTPFRADARLLLAAEGLLAGRLVQNELRPRLSAGSDVADVLARHGIDAAHYADQDNLILLRPQRTAPLTSLASQAVNVEWARSPTVDAYFRDGDSRGALNYHEPLTLRLSEFDQQSPFGAGQTFTWLASLIAPSGHRHRAHFAHSLAVLDAQVSVEGGWMVPLGQEESLRGAFEVFRHLPAAPFKTCSPSTPNARSSNVVVRTLSRGSRTYVYLVNDSPWPAVVRLEMAGAERHAMQSLGGKALPKVERQGGKEVWTLTMEPYELAGAVFGAARVAVTDWQVTHHGTVASELGDLVKEVRGRVNELRHPRTMDALSNPDFETEPQGNEIPGWFFAQRPGVTVELDAQNPKRGDRCLHLRVDNPETIAWVRSKPFAPPRTGRLFVLAWIRTRNRAQQPPLRLSVDGTVNGEPYYRFGPVGIDVDSHTRQPTGQPAEPLPDRWVEMPVLLPIDNLPTHGVTELLVGFDMMGQGEVWIDDVQVFDLYFQVHEQDALLKKVAMADFHLGNGKVSDCAQYLFGYWPRFLLEYVPPPTRVATLPADRPRQPRAAINEESTEPGAEKSTWSQYLRRLRPRVPFRSRE